MHSHLHRRATQARQDELRLWTSLKDVERKNETSIYFRHESEQLTNAKVPDLPRLE